VKAGDILLVNYPFTDGSAAKLRPVLVVSVDPFNQGEDLVFVPISSTPGRNGPHVFELPDSAVFFAQTGLRRTSHVKWTKPLTIAKTVVRSKLGQLPQAELSAIQAHVRELFT
jgi:mRNA interferase MazF